MLITFSMLLPLKRFFEVNRSNPQTHEVPRAQARHDFLVAICFVILCLANQKFEKEGSVKQSSSRFIERNGRKTQDDVFPRGWRVPARDSRERNLRSIFASCSTLFRVLLSEAAQFTAHAKERTPQNDNKVIRQNWERL